MYFIHNIKAGINELFNVGPVLNNDSSYVKPQLLINIYSTTMLCIQFKCNVI